MNVKDRTWSKQSSQHITQFKRSTLSWYAKHKRDLPWRKTTDPYRILVSEIMLQQTQVDRVIPKYNAFLKRFPTARALSKAPTSEVIKSWAGLGYNRRAVFLQRAAQAIVERGGFPKSIEGLGALPGIGPYTARAVAAFAFNASEPALDTNIRRVVSRVFLSGEGTVEELDVLAASLVPKGKGRIWNNAMMDIGATICTAKAPKCDSCPFQNICSAYKNGTPEKYLKIGAKQPKFEESPRYYRGRIIALLRERSRNVNELSRLLKQQQNKITKLISGLERDGLVESGRDRVRLPR